MGRANAGEKHSKATLNWAWLSKWMMILRPLMGYGGSTIKGTPAIKAPFPFMMCTLRVITEQRSRRNKSRLAFKKKKSIL